MNSTEVKSSNSSKNSQANLDKQKLKVLKKAIVEERSQKEELSKELEKLKKKVVDLEQIIQDENQKYTKLYDENNDLHEQNLKLMQ